MDYQLKMRNPGPRHLCMHIVQLVVQPRAVLFLIAILLIWPTESFALDPMGPPVSQSFKEREQGAGFDFMYLYNQMDLKASGLTFGPIELSGTTIKDIKSNKFYADISSSLVIDNFDIFIRIGAVNAKPSTSANQDNLGGYLGQSDYGIAFGGGARITLYESNDSKWKWGGLVQLSFANLDFPSKNLIIGGYTTTFQTTIDVLEIQIATGPTYKLSDTISLYGGPFVHFVNGNADFNGIIEGFPIADEEEPQSGSSSLEQDSSFGGYIGLQTQIRKNLNFNIEFQTTGSGYGIGGGLIWRF